ncbi:hypothetical protein T09_15304 [Trichinella sp. T9]|nr:hypothetical protein T09_15304 [Trichinella sp. T9]
MHVLKTNKCPFAISSAGNIKACNAFGNPGTVCIIQAAESSARGSIIRIPVTAYALGSTAATCSRALPKEFPAGLPTSAGDCCHAPFAAVIILPSFRPAALYKMALFTKKTVSFNYCKDGYVIRYQSVSAPPFCVRHFDVAAIGFGKMSKKINMHFDSTKQFIIDQKKQLLTVPDTALWSTTATCSRALPKECLLFTVTVAKLHLLNRKFNFSRAAEKF